MVIDEEVHSLDAPPLSFVPDPYSYFSSGNDDALTYREVLYYSKCMPADSYKWGFSSLMLFTFCAASIFVGFLVMVLHYDALYNSTADQYELEISAYRDVLDLASELRAHFGAAQVESMSGSELEKEMNHRPARASLDTTELREAEFKASRSATWLTNWSQASSRRFKATEDWLLSVRPG